MHDKFTDRSRRILSIAREQASLCAADSNLETHLLLALLRDVGSIASAALSNCDVDYGNTLAHVQSSYMPPGSPERELTDVVDRALEEAVKLEHYYVGPEHLLIALLRNRSSRVSMLLESAGVNPEEVLQEVFYILGSDMT